MGANYSSYGAYIDPRPLVWYLHSAASSVSSSVSSSFSALRATEYDGAKVAEAIDKLRHTLGYLDEKVSTMTQRTVHYAKSGRELYRSGNRTGALHQMRLKKMYEREIAKIESIKFNIESNILHMESMCVMMETVSTVKDTSSYVQLINKNIDVDRLEGMIEEISEQRDTSQDIESILSQGTDVHYDEDELLRELQELDGDDDAAAAAPATAAAAAAPAATPSAAAPPPSPPCTHAIALSLALPIAPTGDASPIAKAHPVAVEGE